MPQNNEPSYYCAGSNIQGNSSIQGNVKFADPLGYSDLQQQLNQINGYAQLLGVPAPQCPSGLDFCAQYSWAKNTAQTLSNVYENENTPPLIP